MVIYAKLSTRAKNTSVRREVSGLRLACAMCCSLLVKSCMLRSLPTKVTVCHKGGRRKERTSVCLAARLVALLQCTSSVVCSLQQPHGAQEPLAVQLTKALPMQPSEHSRL